MKNYIPKGRAATDKAKEQCLIDLLEIWKRPGQSQLRLGQLLFNANFINPNKPNLFYVEDLDLIQSVIDFGNLFDKEEKE